MRKEILPIYKPKAPPDIKETNPGKNSKHVCEICTHIERIEVERKALEGWRFCDIIEDHRWISSIKVVKAHIVETGLAGDLETIRKIDSRKELEEIIRAGKRSIEKGKVYARDVIDAVKALNELSNKDKTRSVWDFINDTRLNDSPDRTISQ
jgi:hypothetical protein